MLPRYDIAIIGGGIVGNAIARELSRYQLNIILVEKEIEVSFGTSKANSGIIHSGIHDSPLTLKGKLCIEGNDLWGGLSKELKIPFNRVGEIVVARNQDEMPVLEKLLANAKANGIPAEIVGPERLRELEPNLADYMVGGLLAPTAGVIPPYEMTYALYENARQNGVEYLFEAKVANIIRSIPGFIVRAGTHEIRTDRIINAAGVHADDIAALVGANNFKIKPRKGEEYILDSRLNNINNRIIFPTPSPNTKGMLIIKTYEGSTMIGPTADDINDKEDTTTTESGLKRILDFIKTLMPGIRRSDIIASFAGVRPVSNTNDFIIEESRAAQGFINAAGIQSPGLTAAPAIALMVVDILKNSGLRFNRKKNFRRYDRPHRKFVHASLKEKELMHKINPCNGNIICRCETVTEAEVMQAIENGARTLDGIKFRTRAGMGRCQSGFCIHHIMKILSRELDMPEEVITKRGGASYMISEKR